MISNKAFINGIGTAIPSRKLTKDATSEIISKISVNIPEKVISKLVQKSGIEKRYVSNPMYSENDKGSLWEKTATPCETVYKGPSTKERMDLYEYTAPQIALESSKIALSNSNTANEDITHLITISCTGFYAPGIDCFLIEELLLRNNINRVQLGFLGCHAAINGIATAAAIVKADNSAKVLLVSVEICSAHVSFDTDALIPNIIFADGSSALVISSLQNKDTDLKIESQYSYLIPNTKAAMTWKIGDNGFNMHLSPELPNIIESYVGSWVLKDLKLDTNNALWAIHPGGIRVLQATQTALNLTEDNIKISKEVLRDFGNMSSATVIFILEKLIEKRKNEPVYMLGFGPGLFCECVAFS